MNFSISRPSWPPVRAAVALLLTLLTLLAPLASVAQSPGLAEIRSLLARGEAARALPLAEKLAADQPTNAQASFLHGVVLMDLRRDAEATALFERLHQTYPELPDPLNNLGLLHARAGRLDAARLALESALRSDPQHRTARLNLAQVHLMLALRAWEQAGQQAPLPAELQLRLEAVRAWLTPPSR
jgi:Flp pilus assembly protein TadD